MNLTINELARRSGLSAYEIRRRVHNGTLPHTRVGAKQSKILINEDLFNRLLADESFSNVAKAKESRIIDIDSIGSIGYDRLRQIN